MAIQFFGLNGVAAADQPAPADATRRRRRPPHHAAATARRRRQRAA